ncbi:Aminoglycoside/hydroxyurea antibiotic resistance kinase [Amycolatopsis rubida]|uniref:Aminoglycoside/hydroxyurea antibiotic resistance kinase n=1 Tax=Amycolatopsis rubida TaxID=112413 RepID=A0A1I5N936_9PSEU|nr:Aminoglycoside/hydroxyurea antibiotic resistance kinase [Amycolatopsis rubida]
MLQHFAGVVRLLAASADGSTLLLERAGPATLETVRAEDAAEVAGELAAAWQCPRRSGRGRLPHLPSHG